jgi:hypothetical protein
MMLCVCGLGEHVAMSRGYVTWCHSDRTRHRELLNAAGTHCRLGSRISVPDKKKRISVREILQMLGMLLWYGLVCQIELVTPQCPSFFFETIL